MKIVVQNGNNLGKPELDRFVESMPGQWRKLFNTIVVYGSREDDLKITHNKKESQLSIHSPISYKGTAAEALEEIAICLGALHDIGHIPTKLSSSRRETYLNMWREQSTPNE